MSIRWLNLSRRLGLKGKVDLICDAIHDQGFHRTTKRQQHLDVKLVAFRSYNLALLKTKYAEDVLPESRSTFGYESCSNAEGGYTCKKRMKGLVQPMLASFKRECANQVGHAGPLR